MTFRKNWVSFILACPALAVALAAHPPEASSQSQPDVGLENPSSPVKAIVPRLIKFSGTLLDEQGQPMKSPVGVTFALYGQQSGSAALWMETQNVETDTKGNYTALLGTNSAHGVPADLFNSGEARWLGVQAERQVEQPRVLLVSVPYALKAGDAQTLGGLPPSAFLQTQGGSSAVLVPTGTSAAATPAAAPLSGLLAVTTGGLTSGSVPLADGASDIKNSQITDNGTTVAIGGCTPDPTTRLDVCGPASINGALQLPTTGKAVPGPTGGMNSQPFDLFSSTFNSALNGAIPQHFRWQLEPVGQNTPTPGAKVSLLYAAAPAALAETGFSIDNHGLITFAKGQTMPTVMGNETVSGNFAAGGSVSGASAKFTGPVTTGAETVNGNFNATGSVQGSTGNFLANNSTYVLQVTQNGAGVGVNAVNNNGTLPAIFASQTSLTNASAAIYGTSLNPAGAGIEAFNTASTGGTALAAATNSTSGVAVNANAAAASGTSVAIQGQVNSPKGIGLRVTNTAGGFAGKFAGAVSVLGNVGITDTSGTFLGAPSSPLSVVSANTYIPAVLQTSHPFGTWLQLTNTSPGGHTWNILSAGPTNAEGAGNLGITDFTGKSTIWLEGNVIAGKLEADASAQGALGPTLTLTNTAGAAGAAAAVDFNSYAPVNNGNTPNPAARVAAVDQGNYSDDIVFSSNKPGAPNNGLVERMRISSTGGVSINGDTPLSSSPHMSFSAFMPGSFCGDFTCGNFSTGLNTYTSPGGFFVPDKNITITRISVSMQSKVDDSCGIKGGILLTSIPAVDATGTGGTTYYNMGAQGHVYTFDSGPISVPISAGAPIVVQGGTAGACNVGSSGGGGAFVNVEYVMQ
jgi:hypothetical protein